MAWVVVPSERVKSEVPDEIAVAVQAMVEIQISPEATFGKLNDLSDTVGSETVINVSIVFAVVPSKISPETPKISRSAESAISPDVAVD